MTSPIYDSSAEVRVRTVLVPLDGSELSLRAMPTARVLAERFGAQLHTICVAAGDEADRVRALAAALLGVEVGDERALVVPGDDPAEVIAQRSEELDECLLCMSTHGRGRLSGAVVGSVARSVLQRSRKAMVVLGPMADNPGVSPPPRSWPSRCRCRESSPASMAPTPLKRCSRWPRRGRERWG
jgi:nucleotide-binding universal stress UspA family protein